MRSGVAKLLSIPELERRWFRIQYDTFVKWVVISPKGGARLVFKRETGRCDRSPFVYLDDPVTQAVMVTVLAFDDCCVSIIFSKILARVDNKRSFWCFLTSHQVREASIIEEMMPAYPETGLLM